MCDSTQGKNQTQQYIKQAKKDCTQKPIVSKSHGNTSMYADTVINFAKITTYIHTHTTYRISDHLVSF